MNFRLSLSDQILDLEKIISDNEKHYTTKLNEIEFRNLEIIKSLEECKSKLIFENEKIITQHNILLINYDNLKQSSEINEKILKECNDYIKTLEIKIEDLNRAKEDNQNNINALKENEISLNEKINELDIFKINALFNLEDETKNNIRYKNDLYISNKNLKINIDDLEKYKKLYLEADSNNLQLRQQLEEQKHLTGDLILEKEKEIKNLNKSLNDTIKS